MTDFELPDFLEEETEETILNRMLDSLPDDMDKSEGSYIWASLSPVAIELAKVVEWGREVLRRGMTTETFGVYLDMRAADQGISRREAESSTVPVTLTGEPGTTIPEGTRVATPSDNTTPSIEFVTDEEVSIPESGEVATTATAIEPGASGDVPQGSVSIILPGISGVTSVTNPESGSGGYDRETDESLLARVYENSQQDEGDGNIDDYKMWAKQITGVGNVLVDPLWNGPGTIRA
ncbi:baseplate J family protein, partial [Halobacillus trueperi]